MFSQQIFRTRFAAFTAFCLGRATFIQVFIFLCLFASGLPLFAAVTVTAPGNAELKSVLPVGTTGKPVAFFTITAGVADDSVSGMTITNTAGTKSFGDRGITKAYLFQGTSFAAATKIAETLSTGTSCTFTFSTVVIAAATSQSFFVVYDLDSNAAPGGTTSVALGSVTAGSGAVTFSQGSQNSNLITFSGLSTDAAIASTIPTPASVVVPGQSAVPMLKLLVTPKGENVSNPTFTFSNAGSTFATGSAAANGVGKVYLYQDTDANGTFSIAGDTLVAVTENTGLSTPTTVTLSLPNVTLAQNTTKTYFLVYDLGTGTLVTPDASVKAQLTGFSGSGDSSRESFRLVSAVPVNPANSNIAGFQVANMVSAVPSNNFGPDTVVPMLQLDLNAIATAATLNAISVENTGNVKYVTVSGATNGITDISIYLDSNQNSKFDPDGADARIGALALGVPGQSAELAQITLSTPLQIPAYVDTNTPNTKTLFVVYKVGGTSASGVSVNASVHLKQLRGVGTLTSSALITNNDPGTANVRDLVATVNIKSTSLKLTSATSVVPSLAFEGQVNVPMVAFVLKADQSVSGSTLVVQNSSASFNGFNQGVSKVSVYEDKAPQGTFGAEDLLVSAVTSFNSTIANVAIPTIRSGETKYFVCYDVGQVANGNSMACQISDLTVTGNLIFGGNLPQPVQPAQISVLPAPLRMDSISSAVSSLTNTDPSFLVTMKITNQSNPATIVTVNDSFPRLFKQTISGQDLSSEFRITTLDTYPFQLAAGASRNVTFTVSPSQIKSSGQLILDGALQYTVSTASVFVTRYRENVNTWRSGSRLSAQLSAAATLSRYDWELPDIVSAISVRSNGVTQAFFSKNTAPVGAAMAVTFFHQGDFIDPSKMVISTSTLPVATTANTLVLDQDYSYDATTGILTINSVGDSSKRFSIAVSDVNGVALPTANIDVLVSSALKVTRLYPYPNPFTANGQVLTFGYNLTQAAEVTLYIYDELGSRVATVKDSKTIGGYQQTTWDAKLSNGTGIRSGTYLVVMTAKNSDGDMVYAKAKLAVY